MAALFAFPALYHVQSIPIHPPFPVEELLQKLQDLHSAISQGKDSL